jgi:exopolysaccharide biosynthesis predicted pyruvyltransferase EpsI
MANEPSATDTIIRNQMERYKAVVGAYVAHGQPYALLDFPQHFNIGDSAIYTGEHAFLRQHTGRVASCVCTAIANMDWLKGWLPDGPIFLHGGGNFGDIWPQHQNFRLQILEHFKGRNIIQLAQSIHFEDAAIRDETARQIAAHGSFTLLVRDRPSYDLATRHFDCRVEMCPDAALMMWHLPSPRIPKLECLAMLRGDVEAKQSDIHKWLRESLPCDDWVDVNVWSLPTRIGWKLVRTLPENRIGMRYTEAMFYKQAWMRVMAGVHQLSNARFIVTDRLHVHLISSLMRLPHLVLDNSYGKISRYIDSWGKSDLTLMADALEEVQEVLQQGKVLVR